MLQYGPSTVVPVLRYKALAVARCARAEGGACRRLLQAPFAGAVEDAWADPEPHYGHYSLHVSLAAIFARDVEQTNPLLTGGLGRLRGLAHDANRVAQAHVSRPPRLPLRPFA